MPVSITLKYTVKTTEKGTVSINFVTTAYGVSSKVFAIEVMPKSADFEAPNYRFSHVCSPSELVEFPADCPGDCCYFRTDSIELIFDSYDFIDHVIRNMQQDVENLVHEFNALEDTEGTTETITFGEV